ncbi:hypothetical protein NQ314_000634 [Rhamnusium bicolor]|uniref:Saposin B-type domain-containing protein n=1 Tax=Rhamnusium bicolor TaxID=1586634 RepID=A0AAV8ZXQ2_9CUCU|nr:hypothetical protein NQ314_000634 [Rhamnusium bicolor]
MLYIYFLGEFERQIACQFNIKEYKRMEIEKLKKIVDDLKISSTIKQLFLTDRTLCGVCKLLISQIQHRALTVKIMARAFCNIYITLSTWTLSHFCEDVININLPILEYIVENSNILDPELACSVLLQNGRCYYSKPALTWKSQIPSISQMKIPQVTYNPNAKPLKILHLTDFHITPDYEVGGVENCGYPLCCKKGLGNPLFSSKAGIWGDYNCDIPLWLFGNTMFHLNRTHKDIDLVYFTGDIIDHTVWKSSVEENSKLIYFTYRTLFDTFPNKLILPVIGNHESTPLNVYAPNHQGIEEAGLSTQWLYTLLSKLWKPWLPNESLKTVKKQGYYSYSVNPKLKIISLNNNICSNFNWWVLYNTTFFNEQLEFLSNELAEAEENGQFAHIITHMPVGNKECIEPWEVNYNSIVKR